MKLTHKQWLIIGIILLFLVFLMTACQWDWLPFISESPPESPTTQTISPPPAPPGEIVTKEYQWRYKGYWQWTLRIPEELYFYYQGIPRAPIEDYSIYVTHPGDDPYIEELATSLKQKAVEEGFNSEETVNFIASFVQQCIEYKSDLETKQKQEYPRYPLETLVDGTGDCEDKSILTAAMLQAMDYEVVLLSFPEHMAVGVAVTITSPWYCDYEGRRYYYLETTRGGWEVGEFEEMYQGIEPTAYKLVPTPVLRLTEYEYIIHRRWFQSDTLTLEVKVTNWGTADAQGAYICAFFAGGEDKAKQSSPFDLEFGHQVFPITIEELLMPSEGRTLWLQLFHNGIVVDEVSFQI